MNLYRIIKTVGSPVLKITYHPWIMGKENIPKVGAAILASNHNAVWDSVFLPALIKRPIVFMGKSDYFTTKGTKGFITRNFMKAVGTIPVDRSGGMASANALEAGLKVLKSGELFGIYPEGTRSPDGKLYRGKTGVARLSLESGAPIIPVAMVGTHEAQPIGKLLPSRTDIGIIVGRPMDFSRYQRLSKDRYTLRSITDQVMQQLALLSGQEYVDKYAHQVKIQLEIDKKISSNYGGSDSKIDNPLQALEIQVILSAFPHEIAEVFC